MIIYKQIEEANNSLEFIELERINKDGSVTKRKYVEVNQRVKGFRMVHPNGRIQTEIISLKEDSIIMQARIYDDSKELIATAHAQEFRTDDFINLTSFIENCETSAVGRALGFAGFGIDTSVSSYEEVKSAIEKETAIKVSEEKPKKKRNVPLMTEEQSKIINELEDKLKSWVIRKFKLASLEDLSEEEAGWFIEELKKKGAITDGKEA